jgi:hypothetical protein
MPLFRHTLTGNEQTLSQEEADVYPSGTWKKLADESPVEKRDRELREALENKVELVTDDDEPVVDNSPAEESVGHLLPEQKGKK